MAKDCKAPPIVKNLYIMGISLFWYSNQLRSLIIVNNITWLVGISPNIEVFLPPNNLLFFVATTLQSNYDGCGISHQNKQKPKWDMIANAKQNVEKLHKTHLYR